MSNPDLEANRRPSGQFGNAPEKTVADESVSAGLAVDADFKTRLAAVNAELSRTSTDAEALMRLGREGTALLVKDKFPTATEVILTNGNDGPGAPYLLVHSVLNESGEVLWGLDVQPGGLVDYHDDDLEVQEALSDYSTLLDRVPGALEQLTHGWYHEATWRLPLDK